MDGLPSIGENIAREKRMQITSLARLGLAVCVASLLGSAPARARNIIDTAQMAGTFSSWIAAVRDADMEQTLKERGPYTVFAPSDEAFAKLSASQREALKDKSTVARVVKLHLVSGKVLLKDAGDGMQIHTEAGKTLTLHRKRGGMSLDEAVVLEPDVEVDNGVINVMDTVLFP